MVKAIVKKTGEVVHVEWCRDVATEFNSGRIDLYYCQQNDTYYEAKDLKFDNISMLPLALVDWEKREWELARELYVRHMLELDVDDCVKSARFCKKAAKALVGEFVCKSSYKESAMDEIDSANNRWHLGEPMWPKDSQTEKKPLAQ